MYKNITNISQKNSYQMEYYSRCIHITFTSQMKNDEKVDFYL